MSANLVGEPVVMFSETIKGNQNIDKVVQRAKEMLWLHPNEEFVLQIVAQNKGNHDPEPYEIP